MTVSNFVRNKIFNANNIDISFFHNLNYELNKIGTNINQVVKFINEKKGINYDEISSLLNFSSMVSNKLDKIIIALNFINNINNSEINLKNNVDNFIAILHKLDNLEKLIIKENGYGNK